MCTALWTHRDIIATGSHIAVSQCAIVAGCFVECNEVVADIVVERVAVVVKWVRENVRLSCTYTWQHKLTLLALNTFIRRGDVGSHVSHALPHAGKQPLTHVATVHAAAAAFAVVKRKDSTVSKN